MKMLFDRGMDLPSLPFPDVIRHAIRRARLGRELEQAQLAKRMSGLDFNWHPQTVSSVENGKRRVTAEELLGLCLALETSVSYLLRPYGGLTPAPAVTVGHDGLLLPSVVAALVGNGRYEEGWVRWTTDDEPVWPDRATLEELAHVRRDMHKLALEMADGFADYYADESKDLPLLAEQSKARHAELKAREERLSDVLRGWAREDVEREPDS